jgi:hypothetical protein
MLQVVDVVTVDVMTDVLVPHVLTLVVVFCMVISDVSEKDFIMM